MSRSLDLYKWIFHLNVLFLVLLSIPYLYTSPGPRTRMITLLALLPIGVMLLGAGLLAYFEVNAFDF